MKKRLIFYNLTFLIVLNSCCFGTNENHLGNNIYPSEYDNVDRRILYKKEKCANTGTEIVPMTVLEISHNSEWIIVKSGNKRVESEFKYWVIKNNYNRSPNSETIKKNTFEFNDHTLFKDFLVEKI
ncbi:MULTISPECIES: hypothetical protein [Flagellimonas]|uniref:Uncharacterized protein n=1 Tax=Flagellimonas hadalis TaxID=2597517 RepID=A0A5N5IPS8_9FLAO|nr:hypothetical protein [Allomuricauda hadalis]KAB5486892.1 hypothetical protein FOT42_012075 [Allomuricauda hadalis]